ncbi:carboxypeptidase-like regulatory domain-containing protein [Bacteroidota bacterium]
MKSILLFSAALILINITTFATGEGDKNKKNTIITGNVIDDATNESLAGVKVMLSGTDLVTYTDLDGNFEFKNIKSGIYSLACSYISYEEKVIDEITVTTDNVKSIEVELSSN